MSKQADNDALLQQAIAGNCEALETVLLQHFDPLVDFVAPRIPDDVRNTVTAEDVVQDSFIVVFQRIADYSPRQEATFFSWLAQIAENRLMDAVKALRAAKRGGGWGRAAGGVGDSDEIVSLLEMIPGQARTPSRSAAAHDAIRVLEATIEELDPDYRDVLRLRYAESRSAAECAIQLQRSEGAVHMLLSRALAALRARMGDSTRFFTRKA